MIDNDGENVKRLAIRKTETGWAIVGIYSSSEKILATGTDVRSIGYFAMCAGMVKNIAVDFPKEMEL